MLVTIFDTETTGIPKAGAPLAEQPHLLQLAAVSYYHEPFDFDDKCDETPAAAKAAGGPASADFRRLRAVSHFSMLIKDDPIPEIPKAASDVHGIRAPLLDRAGGPPSTALWHFSQMCAQSDRVLAYNAAFDAQILSIALQRCDYPGLEELFVPENLFCLMLSAAPVVRVPPKRSGERFGWPKLAESYQHFTGRELRGAHDAMVDVRAAAAVYSGLLKAGAEIVKAPFESPRSGAASG